jgi:hypothetical protein
LRVAAQYNSGLVSLARLTRDLPLLAALSPPAFRIDAGIGWGVAQSGTHLPGIFGDVVVRSGEAGDLLAYNTSSVVATARLLRSAQAAPVFAWCYVPPPLQNRSGDFTSGPSSLPQWRAMHARLAADLRAAGLPVIHELYNEPDLPWAFAGSWDQYVDMFRAAAQGVLDADPAAQIIAPAAAVPGAARLASLLQVAGEGRVGMAAVSVHAYGGEGVWRPHVQVAADAIAAAESGGAPHALAPSAGVHLNELNVELDEGRRTSFLMGSAVLSTLSALLATPNLAMAHWAQFQDSGAGDKYGLLDVDGRPRASYNAFWLYARMPMHARTPVVVSGASGRCGTMAAANASRAALAVWSNSSQDIAVTCSFTGLAISGEARLTVYAINATHGASGLIEPVLEREGVRVRAGKFALPTLLSAHGVLFVQLDAL